MPKRIPKNFMDRPFLCGFCAASGFEECKTSPTSNNADIASLLCADSNEQYRRRDNIRILGVDEINDEDVYERVVEMANDNGVSISKQKISVCHRLPSRNQISLPKFAKFVRRETKFCVMTHRRNLKNSFKKL